MVAGSLFLYSLTPQSPWLQLNIKPVLIHCYRLDPSTGVLLEKQMEIYSFLAWLCLYRHVESRMQDEKMPMEQNVSIAPLAFFKSITKQRISPDSAYWKQKPEKINVNTVLNFTCNMAVNLWREGFHYWSVINDLNRVANV